MNRLSDREWLLSVLQDGREHTLNEIIQRSFRERGCGLTVHSRTAEIRKCGYTILNRPMPNGGRGSVYRLVTLESPAIEESGPQPVSLAGGSSVDEATDRRLTLEASAARLEPAVADASSVDDQATDRRSSLLGEETSTLPAQLVLDVRGVKRGTRQ